jgi:hypothetical protein
MIAFFMFVNSNSVGAMFGALVRPLQAQRRRPAGDRLPMFWPMFRILCGGQAKFGCIRIAG